jgi:hypothetical protein
MADSLFADVTGVAGPSQVADGAPARLRLGAWRELIVSHGRGKYAERVRRGNCYAAITAATGVSIASLTITTTGQLTVHNPFGSNKILSFFRGTFGMVSGTPGIGNLVYATSPGITATNATGTIAVPKNLLTGLPNSSVALPLTTSTITTPTVVRNLYCLAAASPNAAVNDDIDDEIQLLPGTGLTITGTTAAGSTPIAVFSLSWEEIQM